MFIHSFIKSLIFLLISITSIFAYAGTGGTPLGGIGSGYIVYNAVTGQFAESSERGYEESPLNGSFNLYASVGGSGESRLAITSTDEDAKIPIYRVNYGELKGVEFKLTAFGPYNHGDEYLASLPLAFFEFTVTNNNSEQADASVAMEFDAIVSGSPSQLSNGINWPGNDNTTLLGGASKPPEITVGPSIDDFAADVFLENIHGNILAVKISIGANETEKIHFVASWYRLSERYGYFYYNHFNNSQEIASYGLSNFETISNGAQMIVDRIMGSNLPEWYNDRLLNNLYPWVHNAWFVEDGRLAFMEGRFPWIGTLDQQGHAQLPLSYMLPDINWNQMEYWARTQKHVPEGQIHHDFGGHEICDWDDWQHESYRDIDKWVDLNCMFIMNIYELFLGTGNLEKLQWFWPYMKKAGYRIREQCRWGGPDSYLPTNTESTYDRRGETDVYNGSVMLPTLMILKIVAGIMNEPQEADEWQTWYDNARSEFVERYYQKEYNNMYPWASVARHMGGYAFARAMGLPAILDDDKTFYTFSLMFRNSEHLDEMLDWPLYSVGHFGDLGISIGRADSGLMVHEKDWIEHYTKYPEYIHWQDLDGNAMRSSYMTAPIVWRSLFLMTGFMVDMYKKQLWIRPSLLSSLNGHLTNAPLVMPSCWGTLDYQEDENATITQNMTITFDSTVTFNELRLKNNTGIPNPTVIVYQSGSEVPLTYTIEGTGLDEIIRVIFENPLSIDNNGIQVVVSKEQVAVASKLPVSPNQILSSMSFSTKNGNVHYKISERISESVTISLIDMKGKTLATRILGTGNSQTGTINIGKHLARGMYLIRVKLSNGIFSTYQILNQ